MPKRPREREREKSEHKILTSKNNSSGKKMNKIHRSFLFFFFFDERFCFVISMKLLGRQKFDGTGYWPLITDFKGPLGRRPHAITHPQTENESTYWRIEFRKFQFVSDLLEIDWHVGLITDFFLSEDLGCETPSLKLPRCPLTPAFGPYRLPRPHGTTPRPQDLYLSLTAKSSADAVRVCGAQEREPASSNNSFNTTNLLWTIALAKPFLSCPPSFSILYFKRPAVHRPFIGDE